jgi:hypothetical protein
MDSSIKGWEVYGLASSTRMELQLRRKMNRGMVSERFASMICNKDALATDDSSHQRFSDIGDIDMPTMYCKFGL